MVSTESSQFPEDEASFDETPIDEQVREHALIAQTMGVRQLIIAINHLFTDEEDTMERDYVD